MAADEPLLLIERSNRVAVLTLNRPAVLNAFTDALVVQLTQALRDAERDADVGAVVITGAGRAFCAGQDLGARREIFARGEVPHLGAGLRERYKPMILRIRTMEKPVIAALNGVAAGAGCGLALACDLRTAAPSASLVLSFARVGLALDSGSSFFLPRIVGLGRALELAFTGDPVDAATAERIGLVNRVYPPEELMPRTMELAEKLANGATRALGLIKRDINRALSIDAEAALEYESYQQEVAGRSEDYHEGVMAFLEKRTPTYTGK
ncbi:MAG: 2-(1,2-epoxy,2-dihydrophenyl)acetyl-CoA isomerase [Chloroflexota bacterium]|jgi:2-(1,2-epoxy-1,2-dihydrophenyl)acetyl-CoA isomerase|nr:2-(1,2-epoxy,2-dihydrophenyl)acetyl-CoA isomerase [Chloroflexota bacterium]